MERMQLSGQFFLLEPFQTPGCGLLRTPLNDRGTTTPISPVESAFPDWWFKTTGPNSGFALHQSVPCSASSSVALFVALRWLPSDGGGGRSEVSGTAVCQS